MCGSWKEVAEAHYGLRAPLLWQHRTSYSTHYFIRSGPGAYVLSRVRKEARRPPFADQFTAIATLRAGGFDLAHLPRRTRAGGLYVEHADAYWYLRDYIAQPSAVAWHDGLVAHAAETLVRLHRAGRVHGPAGAPGAEPLDPFHWPVADAVRGLPVLLTRLDTAPLRSSERLYVHDMARRLGDRSGAVLRAASALGLSGLTHHDFRPDNLVVRDDRIVAVLDWDRTATDHQLFDVAFAALQFGHRQCLFPGADLRLAAHFVAAYVNSRFTGSAADDAARATAWMMLFVVVRRLLVGGGERARLRLLRDLDAVLTPDVWAPLGRRPAPVPVAATRSDAPRESPSGALTGALEYRYQ
jgi:Ser/Thr protein kinase RdoA (MazF antagonist)